MIIPLGFFENQSQLHFAARLRRLMRGTFLCLATKMYPKKRAFKPLGLNALVRSKWNSLSAFVGVFRYGRCLLLPFVAHKLGFLANLILKPVRLQAESHSSCHCCDPVFVGARLREWFCF